ncbi:TPA: winged helix-turn-helix domain-containing protein [Enterobacter roggenkampii]|nr:winged helix-turn-helix domain-containing protein [Enterobacter roggenkampii]
MKDVYIIGRRVKFVLSEKSLQRMSDGYTVKLRAPASFCLKVLLDNQGNMVTHDELCYSGWERFGMAASLSVLHNTIYYLRKMLNDTGEFDNKIIETINRRGFVFTLKISVESDKISSETNQNRESEKGSSDRFILNEDDVSSEKENEKEPLPHDASKEFACFSYQTVLNPIEINNHQNFGDNNYYQLNSAPDIYENKNVVENTQKISTANFLRNYLQSKKSVICFIFLSSFLIILSVPAGGIFFNVFFQKDSSIPSYIYKGKLGMCDVYQNNESYNFNDLRLADYLRGYCKENRSLYVTFYPYTNKLSAINCTRKISFFSDDICFSNYFVFKNNGLKNE